MVGLAAARAVCSLVSRGYCAVAVPGLLPAMASLAVERRLEGACASGAAALRLQ